MMHDVTIRRALAGDLAPASELCARLARQHHEADPDRFFLPERVQEGYAGWLARERERPEAIVMVALESERVVGYAYGAVSERDWNLLIDRHGVVHDLFVLDEARGRGTGGRLFDALLAELDALGAPRIVLYTMVGNENAQRLFRARGFRPTLLEMTRSTPAARMP